METTFGKSISTDRNKSELTISEKVRFFRRRAGYSQLNLEAEADLSEGSISRIENENRNPTKETLAKIAKVLELDAKETAFLMDVNIYKNGKNQNLHKINLTY